MSRRTTSARAAAVRQARDAKARRDAERLVRERKVEAALADFFQASGRAAQIRADGKLRADKIVADAEAAAAEADKAARGAVRALRDLEQTNAEIADLCGLSVTTVRVMASCAGNAPGQAPRTAPAAAVGGGDAGAGDGQPGVVVI